MKLIFRTKSSKYEDERGKMKKSEDEVNFIKLFRRRKSEI
jgi:hypothetical protein